MKKKYRVVKQKPSRHQHEIQCPDCGASLVPAGGCAYCPFCGWSPCK